jgi:DNA-binding transcriptional ArsR family regulator
MSPLKSPFSKDVYEHNAQVYKILANPKRLEILNVIRHREATVKSLATLLQIRMSNVSQHLSVLSHVGVVKAHRVGKNVFYQIIDPRIVEPCTLFKQLREKHVI